ncbi:GntR family transcriptional regulator [Maribrevibacterium harenarium]|uniref:GntR family transcriptional regulator n=1 Tax=Maribrevibacterium harenarium TaxID=2589817 RepID=A0A501WHW1_9GAMM|nr:GntR family transcriptional regulator [Maribrevibacterium harenarium]TPE49473.1 GntR family transcriptional regulator [Maribrevibacterium harenarium]
MAVSKSQQKSSTRKIVKGSGAQQVYSTLRREILTLELPPGSFLDENQLADRFKLSRSPVREALIRLSGDGLVIGTSNRASQVAPLDISQFPKYIETLDVAQRMVCRLAAQLRNDTDIERIKETQLAYEQSVGPKNYLAMSETNKAYHMAIAAASKNPYLTDFYRRLLDEGQRMLHLHFEYIMESPEASLNQNEHGRMTDAIVAKDIEAAEQAAHDHTTLFRDRFLRFLQQGFMSGFSVTPK